MSRVGPTSTRAMPCLRPLAMKRKRSLPHFADDACSPRTTLRPDLWRGLPDEILEQIMARLPLDSLMRCRRTCRKYNSLITSGGLQTSLQPGKNLPLWCGVAEESVTTFNSNRNVWSKMSLDFLNSDARVASLQTHGMGLSLEAAGGLLCLISKKTFDLETSVVTVCNPVTKRWRHLIVPHLHPIDASDEAAPVKLGSAMYYDQLESSHGCSVKLVGMVVDKQKQTYKVILARDSNRQGSFQTIMVFDSADDSWEVNDKASGAISLNSFHNISSVVSCDGNLYFLESGLRRRDSRNPVMVKYDSESKIWSRKFSVPKDSQGKPCLIVHRGEVFCVARCSRQIRRTRCVSWMFYKFQESKDSSKWVKVSEMPAEVYEQLCQDERMRPEDMTCVGGGDLVFFSSQATTVHPQEQCLSWESRKLADKTTTERSRTMPVLVHDLREKTWGWLPECPLPDVENASSFSELRSFEPSLMNV